MKRLSYSACFISTLAVSLLASLLSACQPADDPASSTTPPAKQTSEANPADPSTTDPTIVAPPPDATLTLPDTQKPRPILGDDSTEALSDMQNNYDKAISKMNDEMQLMLSMNSIDVAFARGMLGHHRGAMDLTKLATRYGTDAELQQLAEQITLTEQDEIDALKKWLASHPDTRDIDPLTEQTRPAYHYAIEAMNTKMRDARNSNEADVVFAKVMLAHHRGAEAIAKIQLKYGKDEEMRALAAQIIEEQLPEMARLDAWLRARGIVMSPRLVEEKNEAELDNDTELETDNTEKQTELQSIKPVTQS